MRPGREPQRGRVLGRVGSSLGARQRHEQRTTAVRLGLGYVKGVAEEEARALVAERERGGAVSRPRRSRLALGMSARRARAARLGRGLRAARPRRRAGAAPESCGGWGSRAAASACAGGRMPSWRCRCRCPRAPELRPLDSWERIVADYASTGITLGEHPVEVLRPEIDRRLVATPSSPGGPTAPRSRSSDWRRPPAPGDRQGGRLHAARGRGRSGQRDRPPAGLRALPAGGAHGGVRLVEGRLERREGVTNLLASRSSACRRRPASGPRCARSSRRSSASPAATPATLRGRGRRRVPARELAAVAPPAHSFGRRG